MPSLPDPIVCGRPCRLVTAAALLAPLLMAASLAAAVDGYPVLDLDADPDVREDVIGGLVPVFLPPDPATAIELVHAWNGASATLPPTPDGKAGWQVPTLRQCLGATGKAGADPDPSPDLQAWAVIPRRAYRQRPTSEIAQALVFPFLRGPGALVLATPGEAYRQRLQTFVDGRTLAAGASAPPRLDPGAALPAARPASGPAFQWWRLTLVGLGLAVIAGWLCRGPWRLIQVGLGLAVVVVALLA